MNKSLLQKIEQATGGGLTTNKQVREAFATDNSVVSVIPEAVVFPKNTGEISAVVGAVYEGNQSGKRSHLTVRGRGGGGNGSALGSGLILVTSAMCKVLHLDKETITVQAGMSLATLQAILGSHGRTLPLDVDDVGYRTVGGAVADNIVTSKSIKYGSFGDLVESAKVVLGDGSIVTMRGISRRELNRKKGSMNLEGEIYRKFDGLLRDNSLTIRDYTLKLKRNTSGYDLVAVKHTSEFNILKAIGGSGGTLGVITELTLRTSRVSAHISQLVGYFENEECLGEAVLQLAKLGASRVRLASANILIDQLSANPTTAEKLLPETKFEYALVVEFDNSSRLRQNIFTRRTLKVLKAHCLKHLLFRKASERDIVHVMFSGSVGELQKSPSRYVPLVDSVVVPVDKITEFIAGFKKLATKHGFVSARIHGAVADGVISVQPQLDLSKAKDRRKALVYSGDLFTLVRKLDGSASGSGSDGMLKAPYTKRIYDKAFYSLLVKTKAIFDPASVFANPADTTVKDVEQRIRKVYLPKYVSGL